MNNAPRSGFIIACVVAMVWVVSGLAADAGVDDDAVPAIESTPINAICPVTGGAIEPGAPTATLWGHLVGFSSAEARAGFLASPAPDRASFVLGFLEPVNRECPIDGTPAALCKAVTFRDGFAVACCDDRCAAEFDAWAPGQVGAFLRKSVEPINAQTCPQTGDALVPDDPYYVAYDGRLLQLCCDYCLMEWQYQPATREGALRRALGIGPRAAPVTAP